MTMWFCEYSKDGILTLHMTFEADDDKGDACSILEHIYGIFLYEILDLYKLHTSVEFYGEFL